MEEARAVVSLALEERAKAGIKVRQPLARLLIQTKRVADDAALAALVAEEVNVKEVVFSPELAKAVDLDTTITPELRAEGLLRDVVRQIQEMRKKAGLSPHDRITLTFSSDAKGVLQASTDELARSVGATQVRFEDVSDGSEVTIGEHTARVLIQTT
jgi:isoleucyl-tRNA synthetase